MIRCFACGAAISSGHEVERAGHTYHKECPRESTGQIGAEQVEQHSKELIKLVNALELVLLFYRAGPWTEEDRDQWAAITGSPLATTKVMCDHIRKVLNG